MPKSFKQTGAEIQGGANNKLITAAANGHTSVVQQLLAAGADVNVQNKHGNTALSLAAANGHDKVVTHLLAAGADVNVQNKSGYTALLVAIVRGHYKIVERLLAADDAMKASRPAQIVTMADGSKVLKLG